MLVKIYANIREFYRRVFWTNENAVTELGDGYVLSYAGRSWLNGANQLWIDDPACLDAFLLDRAVRFFRQYQAEWSVFVLPELYPQVEARCFRLGGFIRWGNPIMLLEGLPIINGATHPIPVQRVEGLEKRLLASSIMGEAFQMDAGVNRYMVRREHEGDDGIQHYLAYWEHYPAAAATMNYSHDMAGIWNVGTRRIFRRRGLAQALMHRLCSDAHQCGYYHSMLMASSQGQPMYAKMGYQVVGQGCYFGFSAY